MKLEMQHVRRGTTYGIPAALLAVLFMNLGDISKNAKEAGKIFGAYDLAAEAMEQADTNREDFLTYINRLDGYLAAQQQMQQRESWNVAPKSTPVPDTSNAHAIQTPDGRWWCVDGESVWQYNGACDAGRK